MKKLINWILHKEQNLLFEWMEEEKIVEKFDAVLFEGRTLLVDKKTGKFEVL